MTIWGGGVSGVDDSGEDKWGRVCVICDDEFARGLINNHANGGINMAYAVWRQD